MYPATSVPVVSVRYRPTTPLEFASPCGNRDDLELRRSRADSHALAASTTTRACTCCTAPVFLSTYETPVAMPRPSVVTSYAMALVTNVNFPVALAGGISTPELEKFEFVLQPRLHCPQ